MIATPRTSTPSVASPSMAGYASTVATPRTATPSRASLTAAGYAPTVLVPRVTVPGVALVLAATAFAPIVTAINPITATPSTRALSLTYSPVASLGVIVLPGGKFRHPVALLARSFRATPSAASSTVRGLSRTWSYAMSANIIPVQTLGRGRRPLLPL
ncbi:MAG: hypothetical protein U0791_26585 [Gemmataceae bacterium]